ncbi:primosomal protein N' [Kamptonema cortianum]|nr:primosomal protein N' [Oscillatoria laete-virens]MDK3156668.1 primosomal protein N' [Kamptonema cortianum]MDL5053405.1 primosomal protein N' [Oscillatoria laete-virens NRMC-F 0139]
MAQFAKVVLERNLDKEFDYLIPDSLLGVVQVGSKVRVPFGRQILMGFVSSVMSHPDYPDCKPITEVIGKKPFLDHHLLELARWMAGYYSCPYETALRSVMPEAVRKADAAHKEKLFVTLKKPLTPEAAEAFPKRSRKQLMVLQYLQSHGGRFLRDLMEETSTGRSSLDALEDAGWIIISPEAVDRDPFENETFLPSSPLLLNDEQKQAFLTITQAITASSPGVILLHGVTGSGKTEVYLQAMDYCLRHGKGAIVMVPEIALTPQTVERFKSRFAESGTQVAVLHSHLSAGERHDQWHKIHEGRARIVIGARSAVFAPVRELGLIIVDEEHESTYKQEEAPRYNARDVAVMRGKLLGAAVVLGSATPSLESFHNAAKGKYTLRSMPKRIDDKKMPLMRIIDMRQEALRQKGVHIFSGRLRDAIQERLDKSEQTILFLNRRGFATSMVCPKCGHVEMCPHCSVALTYHRGKNLLACHVCGHKAAPPQDCPACHAPDIRYTGLGTEKVEDTLAKLFPKARIRRMDSDTMTRKDSYRETLGAFRTGKIDILLGTQMIAKGLDFPNVTLVGILNADLGLHLPDFRAGERTFQLLTQVAGRAGRGEVEGEVIVQTFTPFHPAVQFARHHDYQGFYEQEIGFRQELKYPPLSHVILITIRGTNDDKAAFVAQSLRKLLAQNAPAGAILGDAAPAPMAKMKTYFRYQIMLRASSVLKLIGHVEAVLKSFTPPEDVLLTVDVDPLFLM